MPHEDCNELTEKSISDNDDIASSPQQCNNINIPPTLPITNEDYNKTTEHSPKNIHDLYSWVVDKILLCKELIFIKEEEEELNYVFCAMSRKRGNQETCLKQCEPAHQKFMQIENKHCVLEYEQHETMRQTFVELENKLHTLNIIFL